MQRPVSLHGDIENDPFRHSYTMEADDSVSDTVEAMKPEDELGRCVLNRPESTDKVGWETNQRNIAVIHPAEDRRTSEKPAACLPQDVPAVSRVPTIWKWVRTSQHLWGRRRVVPSHK